MDNVRDPKSSYRIEILWPPSSDSLTYNITIYPPLKSKYAAAPTIGVMSREDSVPEWMLTAVEMLNMASIDAQADIPFFGTRIGNIYWLHAEQVTNE